LKSMGGIGTAERPPNDGESEFSCPAF